MKIIHIIVQNNTYIRVAGCLNNLVLRNKYRKKVTKSKIYKTTARPIMTYVLETRAETSITRQILEANEIKLLRETVGKTIIDRIRSQQVGILRHPSN